MRIAGIALEPCTLRKQDPAWRFARGASPVTEGVIVTLTGVNNQTVNSVLTFTLGNITKSPYFGLYEVLFDDQLIYTDAKVSYVIVGSVYDPNSKKNLTEAALRQIVARMSACVISAFATPGVRRGSRAERCGRTARNSARSAAAIAARTSSRCVVTHDNGTAGVASRARVFASDVPARPQTT